MHKGLAALSLLVCASALLVTPGCQGSNGAVPIVEPTAPPGFAGLLPGVQELPGLIAKREPAYSEYNLLTYGKYYYSALFHQNVEVSGNCAAFSPQFGDTHGRTLSNLAYCMYLFYIDSDYTDEPEINYGWDMPPEHLSTAWMGVSDHNHEIWRWYPCNTQGHQQINDLDLFFDSTGQVLNVIFVLAGEVLVLVAFAVIVLLQNAQSESLAAYLVVTAASGLGALAVAQISVHRMQARVWRDELFRQLREVLSE